ncbi:hypothetical protein LINPERHAP1_LOCUS34487 [Linum perenne]
MGSLMAGWNSTISDPNSAKYKRNMSLTKEEIDAFWNLKKKVHEEHLQAVSPRSQDGSGSSASWATDQEEAVVKGNLPTAVGSSDSENLEKLIMMKKKKEAAGWWKRSNSAFLNEPPVMEQASTKSYAAQFHVATADANANTRISTH